MNPTDKSGIQIDAATGSVYYFTSDGRRIGLNSTLNSVKWIADEWKNDVFTSVEEGRERPKRVHYTNIDDPMDAVDLAQKISAREGVACEARMNEKTMMWYVIEK